MHTTWSAIMFLYLLPKSFKPEVCPRNHLNLILKSLSIVSAVILSSLTVNVRNFLNL